MTTTPKTRFRTADLERNPGTGRRTRVRGVRCAKRHSGNTNLIAFPGDSHAECAGCLTYYTVDQCRQMAEAGV